MSSIMSSKDIALAGLPLARSVVGKTRDTLSQLINFRVQSLPIPASTLRDYDRVWFHFKQPIFPIDTFNLFPTISTLTDFLTSIDSVYAGIADSLNDTNAGSIFRDPPADFFGPSVMAFAEKGTRTPQDPPASPDWPDGIYFKSAFASLGPSKRAEITVHECAHFQNNDIIQDNAQPGFPNYQNMNASLALRNAYSYSQFALDCAFGRTQPFSDNE
jgi:hypothetical protein